MLPEMVRFPWHIFLDSYGNVIYVDHGHGYETRYAHLSSFAIKPGDRVNRGHVIGSCG